MTNRPVKVETGNYTREDIEENKTMAGLAYLIFFLPLIVSPDSGYGKFHANQALILWIIAVSGRLILPLIPFIGGILNTLLSVALLVLGIMGMINGFGGRAEELPIIGHYRIIK